MSAVTPLCRFMEINSSALTKQENLLLEAELLLYTCEELKEFFRKQYKDYFHSMKFSKDKENSMLETSFVQLILKDILSTEEYNIQGIACYTDTHEDVIQDVLNGRNTNPSATLLRRSIDLHRSVRRELYKTILKKILTQHLNILK